jgi:hypothetical protein
MRTAYLAVLLIGCNQPISDETRLVDLDDEDARVLCEESKSTLYFPTPEQLCTFSALQASTDEASCATLRDGCVRMIDTSELAPNCSTVTAYWDGCDATVGDLRACNEASGALYADIYARSVCENAGTPDAPIAGSIVPPAACVVLQPCGTP